MSALRPPKQGPGRPRKPQAPRTDAQVSLAVAIETAELARDEAARAYGGVTNVAAELALLSAELSVSTAWAAYLRSTGDHTHALKYAEDRTKVAGRIRDLRELVATDQLGELMAIKERESAAGRMV